VGIHLLLCSTCCFLNINNAITWQLIRTVRTLEANWQVLWGSVGTGTKEDESSTGRIWAAGFHHVRARSGLGRVWAAGFHHVTARSRLARVLKLVNRLFL
jgi:hypothetical protein